MIDAWSVKAPVTTRVVCPKCDHLHRPILRKSCACCAVDISNTETDTSLIVDV